MPIYDYFCQACNTQSEISHRISDPPATICPVCGKPALTKQMSAAAFRLKGGGWYETDFKSGDKRNLASDGGVAPAAATTAAPAASTPAASTPAAAAPAPSAPAPKPSTP